MTMTSSPAPLELRISLPGRWTRTELTDAAHVAASVTALADFVDAHAETDVLRRDALRDQLERAALGARRDGAALLYFLISPEAAAPWPLLLFVGTSTNAPDAEMRGAEVETVAAGPYDTVVRTYQPRPSEDPLGIPFGRLSYRIQVSDERTVDLVFRFLPVDEQDLLFDFCEKVVSGVDVA